MQRIDAETSIKVEAASQVGTDMIFLSWNCNSAIIFTVEYGYSNT